MTPFEKYTNLEVHTDGLENFYHVSYIETLPTRNGYEFNRVKLKVEKDKLEKIIKEIITISNSK